MPIPNCSVDSGRRWKIAPPRSAPIEKETRKIRILFKDFLDIKNEKTPANPKAPFKKVINNIQYKISIRILND